MYYKPVHTNVPKELTQMSPTKKQDIPFYYHQFDFNLLFSGLSEQLVPSSAITTEVRESIAKLSISLSIITIRYAKSGYSSFR